MSSSHPNKKDYGTTTGNNKQQDRQHAFTTATSSTSGSLPETVISNSNTTSSSSSSSSPLSQKFNLGDEFQRLLEIAFPSVALQFNMYILYPLAASEVGRTLGTEALAGLSLGCLVGNITCLSMLVGVLTAADTLMPRAYGAGRYAEVGRLAVRAFLVCLALLIPPVIPLCTLLEPIMGALGQDPVASALAASWIRVYLLGVPANLAMRVIQRFLVAQSLPWPPVYASTIPSLVIFPILIRVMVTPSRMGFLGSAAAISITQWLMLVLVLLYLRLRPVYKAATWPGVSWSFLRECVRWDKLVGFVSLSLGGVMSLSEWWFWEAMCFVAGSFGTVAFCAHSIAYNIIPLLFMLPLGTAIGVTVRIGQVLPVDAPRAKLIAMWSLKLIFVIGCVLAAMLYVLEEFVVGLFTNDADVFKACHRIWPFVCLHIWIDCFFCIQCAVMRGLALQWRLGICITGCLWVAALPLIFWTAVHNHQGLIGQWILIPTSYLLMQFVQWSSYASVDWDLKSFQAQERMRAHCTDKFYIPEDSLALIENDSTFSP